MTARAPFEIWEKILKYSISVPLFLDPDPVTNDGPQCLRDYRSETEYWESERTRNRLRRVCRSWDNFMQSYNHRYVYLSDVAHHRVPTDAIPKAIRLNLVPDITCRCHLCYKGRSFRLNIVICDMIAQLLLSMDTSSEEGAEAPLLLWKTEIIDGSISRYTEFLESLLSRAPKLRTLTDTSLQNVMEIQHLLPNLLYLSTAHNSAPVGCKNPTWPDMHLPHLSTLQVRIYGAYFPLEKWILPSLKHLSISNNGSCDNETHFGPKLHEIVRHLGRNLVTLYYNCSDPFFRIPQGMWTYLPHLEHISMPHWGLECPPDNHPVRYIRISPQYLRDSMMTMNYNSMESILEFLPHWDRRSAPKSLPQITAVLQMNGTWLETLALSRTTEEASIALYIASHYNGSSTKFTDSKNLTLDQYIIFMIGAYWKAGLASRTRLNHRSVIDLSF